ncbi:MAG: secondary thiamine-phosphate synthase enzyme YjbQ [Verrucomicrobia bacterium]|nr:secondary thiamine-phosphate synthase enzyme YjbQ [Verrucomicrobiota bacterium]MCF7708788.1 secondary thiamine-phosphate synthase enzyme YjbQ [Verrucomicrobiota bacterium]
MVFRSQLSIETTGHRDIHDITSEVSRIVSDSKIRQGIVHVFNIGSTGTIGTIEFEPGLERDLPDVLDKLLPPSRHYGHEQTWHDGNGHSHLQATMMGPSLTVPVESGRLFLGTWQQIFHLECDIKPRRRTIVVTVIGE